MMEYLGFNKKKPRPSKRDIFKLLDAHLSEDVSETDEHKLHDKYNGYRYTVIRTRVQDEK
jgi:hypothetical protein